MSKELRSYGVFFSWKISGGEDLSILKNFIEAISSSQEISHSSQQPVINCKSIAFELHIMLCKLFVHGKLIYWSLFYGVESAIFVNGIC